MNIKLNSQQVKCKIKKNKKFRIEGKWSFYKFQSGKLIKKQGDEPIEIDSSSISTHIDLTNGKKDFKYQPKIIYTMNMFVNGAGGGDLIIKKGC